MYFPERRIEPPDYFEKTIYCPICGEEEPEELRLIPTFSFAYLLDDVVGCEKCMPDIEDDDVITLSDRDEIFRLLGGCD